MVTPELVEELLVSGHQIGKCLHQHPCCRKRYPLEECQEKGAYYYLHHYPLSMWLGSESVGVFVVLEDRKRSSTMRLPSAGERPKDWHAHNAFFLVR